MGSYDSVRQRTGWGVPGSADTSRSKAEIDELVALTHHDDAKVRKIAVSNLCPCHVRADMPAAWDRIVDLAHDPSPLVRRAVVHMLADGSPRSRQQQVITALTELRNDPDRKVRRLVHHVLGEHRRSGRVNVL